MTRKDTAHTCDSLPRGRLWGSKDHKKHIGKMMPWLLNKQKTPNLISSFLTASIGKLMPLGPGEAGFMGEGVGGGKEEGRRHREPRAACLLHRQPGRE